MGKKRSQQRPIPIKRCKQLAGKLIIELNDCFTEDSPSGGEKGTGIKVVFSSKSKVHMCRVDLRCLLKDWKGNQCDFLFYQCTTEEMHFVELKKTADWEHAFRQVDSTINHLSSKLKMPFDNAD